MINSIYLTICDGFFFPVAVIGFFLQLSAAEVTPAFAEGGQIKGFLPKNLRQLQLIGLDVFCFMYLSFDFTFMNLKLVLGYESSL